MISFALDKTVGRARRGRLTTLHGVVETPVFMPVGTLATVKALDFRDLGELGARMILNNAYHLMLRPGSKVVRDYLTKAGTPPSRLDVSAEVTFEKLEGGWTVVAIALTVTGSVANFSVEDFTRIAEAAKAGCPISRALSTDIAVSVVATLL